MYQVLGGPVSRDARPMAVGPQCRSSTGNPSVLSGVTGHPDSAFLKHPEESTRSSRVTATTLA